MLLRDRIRRVFSELPGAMAGETEAGPPGPGGGAAARGRAAAPRPEAATGRRLKRARKVLRQLTRAVGAGRDLDVLVGLYADRLATAGRSTAEQRALLSPAPHRTGPHPRDAWPRRVMDLDIDGLRRNLRRLAAAGAGRLDDRAGPGGDGPGGRGRRAAARASARSASATGRSSCIALRRRARRLRYAAEVEDALRGEDSRAPALWKRLQDGIGVLHDHHVLAVLARGAGADGRGPGPDDRGPGRPARAAPLPARGPPAPRHAPRGAAGRPRAARARGDGPREASRRPSRRALRRGSERRCGSSSFATRSRSLTGRRATPTRTGRSRRRARRGSARRRAASRGLSTAPTPSSRARGSAPGRPPRSRVRPGRSSRRRRRPSPGGRSRSRLPSSTVTRPTPRSRSSATSRTSPSSSRASSERSAPSGSSSRRAASRSSSCAGPLAEGGTLAAYLPPKILRKL